ncbi:MAG: toprim domain-containing protein, partial [Candidatus Magasanikbacteria bacterium]
PKYLNSPETPVYNKSKILYGLNKTKQSIVNSGSVILVEGQMDLLMLYQAGFENVVAVSGTGLTQQHLKKLSRLSDRIIVSFDNDSGGIRALESALDMFSKVDLHVEVLGLGEFEDPAKAIQEDPEYFEQSLKNSKPAFRHLFEHYFKGDNSGDMVDMKNTVRHLLKKISKLQSSVDKDMWLDELSDYSGISTHALKSELDKISNNKKSKSQKSSKNKKTRKDKENRRARISKRLILLGFTDDELWSIIESNRKWFPKKYRKIIDNPDSEEGSYLELKSSYKKEDKNREEIKNELEDLLRNLKLEGLQKKQKSLRKRMRSNSNPEEKKELINKFHSVSKKIDELKRKV